MQQNTILYLASTSRTRQMLLQQAHINFQVIAQNSTEKNHDHMNLLTQRVEAIAQEKIEQAVLPVVPENQVIFILAADTLTQAANGEIYGKPENYEHAVTMIKAQRGQSVVVTGFCLERKIFKNNSWHVEHRITQVVESGCYMYIPDNWIDSYIQNTSALQAAGAMVIENFGAQFVKYIQGSYSGILGLPLYELRQALESIGFFV